MVHSLDESVGRVRKALTRLGLEKNTIVVFTSDNGGLLRVPGRAGQRPGRPPGGTPITSNVPLRGGKAWIHEGGLRVPLVVHWPGVTRPGSKTDTPAVSVDYFPTILDE